MKHLTVTILIALFLSSCTKNDETTEDPSPVVISMLEIRSVGKIPINAVKICLTELLHNSYSELPLQSKTAKDTVTLSIPFHTIPQKFDAIVSVSYKDGTTQNTTLRNIELKKGKREVYITNFYNAGLQIQYEDTWLETDTINVEF